MIRRARLLLAAAVLAGGASAAFSPAGANAQPCEDTNCVTNPVSAVVCTAEHAKDWKNVKHHLQTCFTQPTG